MIRLLIADDHQIFRQGLRRLLEDHDDLTVVAEAANYDEVIKAVSNHAIDLAILDLTMPGQPGADMISQVKALAPKIRILVLTMHDEETYIQDALKSGAEGYMTKEYAADELVTVVYKLAAGGKYLCPACAERMAFSMFRANKDDEPHTRLSPREYEIFKMLTAGKRGSEIAQELSLSEKTVSTHKINLLKKMNMQNDTELVLYAVTHKLIPT